MDLSQVSELGVGLPLTVLATVGLLLFVFRELGPSSGLGGQGKLFLAAGLGMGIVAFAIKLVAIAMVTNIPPRALAPRTPTQHVADWMNEVPERAATVHRVEAGVTPYVWQALPLHAPDPPGNPSTPEKIKLGERLFFDSALSVNGKVSCSSCHDVRQGAGVDGRQVSVGVFGKTGRRNAPTVWNAAFQTRLFWDGRAASLEEQATGPMINTLEMGMPSLRAVEERVASDRSYKELFERAFGSTLPIVTIERIAASIAAYERTLITPDSPYDRFVRGDTAALSQSQLRGMALFQSIGCVLCHSGANFSGSSVFDGTAPLRAFPALPTPYDERYKLTADRGLVQSSSGPGVWRIPSLRNVALTGPYFHNGSVESLAEAVRIMASAQLGIAVDAEQHSANVATWFPQDRVLAPANRQTLSRRDIDDIVEFLKTLTSESLDKRVQTSNRRYLTRSPTCESECSPQPRDLVHVGLARPKS